jgi:L-aspartate oxidase
MRVIVVGSGAGGLMSAWRASALGHEVTLVTKADLPESNTRYAQGGIAAVMGPWLPSGDEIVVPGDTVESHIADTLVAGAGLCDTNAVEVLCAEGPWRINDLLDHGLDLDRIAGPGSPLARGREAAHSADRVLHSHGDATGLALEIALLASVKASDIETVEHAFLRDLVVEGTDASTRRVVGVDLVYADGTDEVRYADAVILATGGAGQLFAHTTNPFVTTGDGLAAALRAGAAAADLEFYQFHPTALAVAGTPLISEAVRGDGAVLRDASGHRFMLDIHPDGELAPRDVVARGIAAAMAAQGGEPVVLDATTVHEPDWRFPGLTEVLHAHGFSWAQPFPVTPAAHYWMGGIATDQSGRTSLPGLLAVGEVARTGVHGANRLASNSLLEALVFGWRAAAALDGLDALGEPQELAADWPVGFAEPRTLVGEPAGLTSSPLGCAWSPWDLDPAGVAPFSRVGLQALMWDQVGLVRDAAGLRAAADMLDAWSAAGAPGFRDALRAPVPEALEGQPPIAALEDRNLRDLGRAIITAALTRTESRGAHARADFPESDPAQAHSTAWVLPAASLIPAREPAHVAAPEVSR